MAIPKDAKDYAQTLINIWGRQKYGGEDGDRFTFSVERGDDGYCETCSSPYSYVSVKKNGREVAEMRDVEIHTLLAEIMCPLHSKD